MWTCNFALGEKIKKEVLGRGALLVSGWEHAAQLSSLCWLVVIFLLFNFSSL